MKTILVAIREADAEDRALLQKVARLATAFRAQVELLTVSPPLLYDSVGVYGELVADTQRALVQRTAAALEADAATLRAAGIATSVAVEVDVRAHEAIARRAGALGADLVVVGCHASHRLASLLRYTDWELVRLCPVPLLLIKNAELWPAVRVLAAIDPEHSFDKPAQLDRLILRQAAMFATSLQGELHVVHANPIAPITALPSLSATPAVLSQLRSDTTERARRACESLLRSAGVSGSLHLASDVASVAIPRVAGQCDADIVVMGAVSRSLPKRWLLGDTALKVLDQVHADVLIVKPPKPGVAMMVDETRPASWA